MPTDASPSKAPDTKRRRTSSGPSTTENSKCKPDASVLDNAASATAQPTQAKWFRKPSVVWFRGHDLRVEDHPALLAAAQRGGPVIPLFIWDDEDHFGRGLGEVKRWWLQQSLIQLVKDLKKLGVELFTRAGRCPVVLREFIKVTGADAVFWNRCYEPELLQRDEEMRAQLGQEGLTAESFKAELLVEPWELSCSDSSPMFKTFHEFMQAWMAFPPPPHPLPCPTRLKSLQSPDVPCGPVEELELNCPPDLAERLQENWTPGSDHAKVQLEIFLRDVFHVFGEPNYRQRNKESSRLSPHIRFGELSPRRMYHATRLRVSQGYAGSDIPSPIAAALGLSQLMRSGDGKTSLPNQQGRSGSDSSAYSSQNPNFAAQRKERDHGESEGRNSGATPQSVPAQSPNGDGKPSSSPTASNDRDRSSDGSQDMPRIYMAAKAFLKNLCLRDYSYHVLFHHPDFSSKPVVPEFVQFPWAKDNGTFNAWRFGKTGYPIVDAAMRELRETGWVHNSMRFLLACFLTKYLLLPWTRGLKEFYALLLDGDHAANALGWQWTSGSNTDSFPFSCLLNPVRIATRQDPSGAYVRRWVPELANLPKEYLHQPWKAPTDVMLASGVKYGETYPVRIVESGVARKRAKDAMLFMKQVFAAMRPKRAFTSQPLEKLLKEWPEDSVAEDEDEKNADSSFTKAGLFPSLWSLFDDPPVLTSADSGNDVGGDLSDENADSMERALLNAHSVAADRDLIDSMDIGNSLRGFARRNGHQGIEPESRNGSGSQDAIMPATSTQVQQPNVTGPKANDGPVVHPQTGSVIAPIGATIPQLTGHPPAPRQPVLMPMPLNQLHQTGSPVVFDPMYASGIPPAGTAPIPVANYPIMVSAGHANGEVIGSNGLSHADMNNRALYAHRMMYGIPFPVVPAQRTSPTDREQAQPTQSAPAASNAATNLRQVNMTPQPNFCFPPYGLYGNHGYEHAPASGQLNGTEGTQFGSAHMAPSPAIHPGVPHGAPHVVPHSIFLPQNRGVGGNAAYSNVRPTPPSDYQNINANEDTAVDGSQVVPTSSQRRNSLPNGAYFPNGENGTSQAQKEGIPVSNKPGEGTSSSKRPRSTGKRGASASRTASGNTASRVHGNSRGMTKGVSVRSPGGSRNRVSRTKRSSTSRGGRARSESRSVSSVGNSSARIGGDNHRHGEAKESTLEERQTILKTISEQEDHEYHHFANFLTRTYELTKYTDQKTSKDFVRLCTLKDKYHMQCRSEKDKLKIYSIKGFFSKILQLEVTGEWDRHNHGGLRGPYAYGIRERTDG